MLQWHRNDGDSVVLRHGLVLDGYGQHGAQHGLTCPDSRQGHKRAQGGAARHHAGLVGFRGGLLDCQRVIPPLSLNPGKSQSVSRDHKGYTQLFRPLSLKDRNKLRIVFIHPIKLANTYYLSFITTRRFSTPD